MEPENTENEPPKDLIDNVGKMASNMESSSAGFRIRNVSEINASSLNETAENSNKRKFWAPTEVAGESENECTKAKRANNKDDILKPTSVKIEKKDTDSDHTESVQIKIEPSSSQAVEEQEITDTEKIVVKFEATTETTNDAPSCSNGNVSSTQAEVKVEKCIANSTTRVSCRFGIGCYRQSNGHRQEEAHPGDVDYRRPTFPAPPAGTPACPYGQSCYRRNPAHFQEYSHPAENLYVPHIPHNSVILQNNPYPMQQPEANRQDETSDFEDDYFEPFSDDGDNDEYVPSDDDNHSDEFSGDYDDCDRVEE